MIPSPEHPSPGSEHFEHSEPEFPDHMRSPSSAGSRTCFWMPAGSSLTVQAVAPALPAQCRLSSLGTGLFVCLPGCWGLVLAMEMLPMAAGIVMESKKPLHRQWRCTQQSACAQSNLGCHSGLGVGREVWAAGGKFVNRRGCMAMALGLKRCLDIGILET